MRLGLDIGRCITAPAADGGLSPHDTPFFAASIEEAVRLTPPNDGAFKAIAALVVRFDARVWLVSKAGPRAEATSRAWLTHYRFFEITGVSEKHLCFVRRRREKADVCRELLITHFVDDRLDVLQYMQEWVPNRYLFGPQPPRQVVPRGIVRVRDWRAAREIVGRKS